MERFAAIVTAQRAAPVEAPAPAAKVLESKGKGEEDAAYLSIQLEEIVIVKNDADASLVGAARGRSTLAAGGGFSPSSSSMGQRFAAAAAAAAPSASGMSAAATAAARGALSTTVGWIVGSDHQRSGGRSRCCSC